MMQVVPGSFRAADWYATERFEALVHSQKPAVQWAPVTPYDLESRRIAEGIHPKLILDTFRPSSILDYGCGFGSLLTLLKEQSPAEAHHFTGYDPNASTDVYRQLPAGTFDLVICREVLEHVPVREILGVIRTLVSKSRRYVYGTTRFHPNPSHLLDVMDHDDLDPTHITLLNRSFLDVLFVLHGCIRRKDLETAMDWRGLGRAFVYEVPR